ASSQRNGERKDARTFPPGPPSPSAVLTKNGGQAKFRKLPPSWAHKHTPKMGWHGKSFCYPVLLQLSSITGREEKADVLYKSRVRATPVSVFFLKTPTQRLKLQPFAPQSEKSLIFRGALRESKGH
ncbi:MAG: hypothetical protein J6R89_06920, partial [Clostridia bacterium]|nr:hypothetical protein [Clostridia bacterium]